MNCVLLEKTEKLTLYILQLEKRLKNLKTTKTNKLKNKFCIFIKMTS